MKNLQITMAATVAAAFLLIPLSSLADKRVDPPKKSAKAKPYTLNTCIVTDEKLGEMGDPYVFAHKGREIKMCCKGCRKDFDKQPAKFIKKLEAAEKKAGEKTPPPNR